MPVTALVLNQIAASNSAACARGRVTRTPTPCSRAVSHSAPRWNREAHARRIAEQARRSCVSPSCSASAAAPEMDSRLSRASPPGERPGPSGPACHRWKPSQNAATGDWQLAFNTRAIARSAVGGLHCHRIAQLLENGPQLRVVFHALNAQNTLRGCREHFRGQELLTDVMVELKAFETGRRENNRVVVAIFKFGEARVHVPAQRFDTKIGTQHLELRLASQAGAANAGVLWQLIDSFAVSSNQRVPVIGARHRCGKTKTVGQLCRDILHRMDGEIGLAIFAWRPQVP